MSGSCASLSCYFKPVWVTFFVNIFTNLQQCLKIRLERDMPTTSREEEPPDDFRSLSVFPTKADLSELHPFIRVNVTTSAYRR